ITTAALATLSGPDPFRRLTALTLCDMGLRCEGCEVFAGGTGLQRLRWVRLEGNLIDSTGAAALARARLSAGGSSAPFDFNAIETDGAAALAASPFLENVRYLNLAGNRIGARGAIALAESPHFPNLKALDLTGCGIGDTGALALANSLTMRNVTRLNLRNNNLTDVGMAALAKLKFEKPHLQVDLAGNPGDG